MLLKLIVLFIATIVAFWISAVCGGGASLILMPVLNLVLPASVTPFALTVGTLTSSASRIVIFKKHIQWKIFFWFVPFSLPAVLLGAWVMKYVNPAYLEFFVALFLLANVSELFRGKRRQENEEAPYPKYVLAVVGFFAGLISGITGAIGLLFNRFYLRYGLTKEQIIATRAVNEIFLHSIKLVIYFVLGLYSSQALWLGVTVAFASVVSSYSIKYILPYISEYLFRKIGYGAMVISGLFLLISTSRNIIREDKIRLVNNDDETTIKWRQSNLTMEYSFNDGFEIERPIQAGELPEDLKSKYRQYLVYYDEILLEKVFRFGEKPAYEFNCLKGKKMTKLEFTGS